MCRTSRIFVSITLAPNPKIRSKPSAKVSRFSMFDIDLIEPFFSRKKRTDDVAELQMVDKPLFTDSTRIAFIRSFSFNVISPSPSC